MLTVCDELTSPATLVATSFCICSSFWVDRDRFKKSTLAAPAWRKKGVLTATPTIRSPRYVYILDNSS